MRRTRRKATRATKDKKQRELDRQIGARLRALRLKLGFTQSQLGDPLGLDFRQIGKYESGENSMNALRILGFCKTLSVTPNTLLGYDTEPEVRRVYGMDETVLRIIAKVERLPPEGRNKVHTFATQLTSS